MRHTKIEVPVMIVEDSDLEKFTDEARVDGSWEEKLKELQALFPRELTVRASMSMGKGGASVPYMLVGRGAMAVKLYAGDALAMLPTGPAKIPTELAEVAPIPKKASAAKKSAQKSAED